MADRKTKYRDNVNGKFYVDKQCIACDACIGLAPEFFSMNDDEAHAYVHLQPKDSNEIKLCEEAMEICPVEAIGSNGDPDRL